MPELPPDALAELLERAWHDIESGRSREALARLDALDDDVFEKHAYAVHALLDRGEPARARAVLTGLEQRVEDADDPDVAWLGGLVALACGRPEDALVCFERVRGGDPEWRAELAAQRALALDHLGRFEEAGRELARAHALDPRGHAAPLALDAEAFDGLLSAAAEALPETYRERLEEIPVVVEPTPARGLVAGGFPPDLLGLWDPGHDEAPPRILLFQRNLERAFPDREDLAREIATTLYHELGHALGFDEDGLEEIGLD